MSQRIERETTLVDPRLPTNVVTLEDALNYVSDKTLSETLSLALENGYHLVGIEVLSDERIEYDLLAWEYEQ